MVYVEDELRTQFENETIKHINVLISFSGDYQVLEQRIKSKGMLPIKSESILLGIFAMAIDKEQLTVLEQLKGIDSIEIDKDVYTS